jgi:hypothetical protein
MARNVRVKAIKRRGVDEDKLALAFLMLAKAMTEQNKLAEAKGEESSRDQEAA